MEYYFININGSYYGKRNQYLPLNRKDNYELALIIQEIGYKSYSSALNRLKNIIKEYKERNLFIKKYGIEKTKVVKEGK